LPALRRLRVSDNRRFLVHEDDGTPFFYLADTAWELFHRLDREEADRYLRDRAAKGYTAIQAVALAELDGLREPNRYGHQPLVGDDPARPDEPYWEHVDWVVARANALGLRVALLPTWGDKWNKKWGAGPEVFTPENARAYGRFLGERYRDAGIIWVLGGDRPVESDAHKEIIRATAAGIKEGDGGVHLMTFHPQGGQTSAQNFHADDWLDFNMWQSGHSRNRDNYVCITADRALSPTKPTLDAEPGYEDHPAGFNLDNGHLDDWDCRKALYWSLFAGACGHTYGCHDIWQFWAPPRKPITHARTPWYEAVRLPGAGQMQWGKTLVLSRPYLTREPAPDLVVGEAGTGSQHVEAARGADGDFAFVYFPMGRPVTVDLSKLSGPALNGWWFDPRTGTAERVAGSLSAGDGPREFTPPPGGPDWVLVLDDASRGFGAPGADVAKENRA
jgi:hypothetical protein